MQPPPLPVNPYSAPQATVRDPEARYSTDFQYAGFWLRFVAAIIDTLVGTAISFVIVMLFAILVVVGFSGGGAKGEQMLMFVPLISMLLCLIVSWLYFALGEASRWQATPGKKVLGLCVTDLNGAPIGFGRASGRFWGKLISYVILYIGFMMAGWTEKKQGLHDIMAGTLVIRG